MFLYANYTYFGASSYKLDSCVSIFGLDQLRMIHTLSTVGSTRALFFRGPCGVSPLLVPSPGPGAKDMSSEAYKYCLIQIPQQIAQQCGVVLGHTYYHNIFIWQTKMRGQIEEHMFYIQSL